MQKLKKTGGKAKMTIPSLSKQSNVEEKEIGKKWTLG